MMTLENSNDRSRVLWGIGTSRTIRAHWALIELGLKYRTEPLQTRTPEMEDPRFLAINPKMKVPTLCDGDFTLTESPAIVTYLAERYSTKEFRLIPADLAARARYFEWVSFVSMELDATTLYVLRRHESLPHIYGEAEQANIASREYFDRMITAATERFEPLGPYLLGADFSGADIIFTTCLDWANNYNVPVPDMFQTYRDFVAERPGYQAARRANDPS